LKALELRKIEAMKVAATLAAKNKKIKETVSMMTAMDSCAQKGTVEGSKKCFAAV